MRHNLTNLYDQHDSFPSSSLSHGGTGLYRLLPGSVSFLSCLLALISRHQCPTPLLYPVHRISTSLFSRISLGFPAHRLVLSLLLGSPLVTTSSRPRDAQHEPDTKPIYYDLLSTSHHHHRRRRRHHRDLPNPAHTQASRRRPCLTPHRLIQLSRRGVFF
jgi:hypothetical protein